MSSAQDAPMVGTRVVPFLCVADGKVIPGLLALLASAVTHLARGWRLSVHVLDLGLSDAEQNFIRKALRPFGERVALGFRKLDVDVSECFQGSVHVHVAAYGKCFLPEMFSDLSWGIYADVDMLIGLDLSKLAHSSLGGYPLAAVQDWEGKCGDRLPRELLAAEGIDLETPYFNTGFMVLDLEQMRLMQMQHAMLALIREYGEHFKYLDQDAYNIVLRGRWMRLDPACNTLFTLTEDVPRRLPWRACNPHTIGRNKAWKFKRVGAAGLVRSFYGYLDKTDAGYGDCPGASLAYPRGLARWRLYWGYYRRKILRFVLEGE